MWYLSGALRINIPEKILGKVFLADGSAGTRIKSKAEKMSVVKTGWTPESLVCRLKCLLKVGKEEKSRISSSL